MRYGDPALHLPGRYFVSATFRVRREPLMRESKPLKILVTACASILALVSTPAIAADVEIAGQMTGHWAALTALVVFIIGYALVISEETIHLRKSKPMMVAAGIVWILVAIAYQQNGQGELVEELVRHGLLEFVELFLFLLAAMTYINTMDERGVFDVLRAWLLTQEFSVRSRSSCRPWRTT